uniref:Tudor domain-containing protein n=1 Tax=Glossina palpalis gambiensis TaxID=67801 RepID=A0A1B0C1N4_9MUSC
MFQNTPLANTPALKFIIGLGLCTIGGAMLFAYFRARDDDDSVDECEKKKIEKKKPKIMNIEVKIPNQDIPLIAGRSGANIRSIEEKTQTKINFRAKDDSSQLCEIVGYPDNVKEARSMLAKELERSPIVTQHVYVPQDVCGKIMGRCGEAMQEICRISLAKVSVESGLNNVNSRRITVTGNNRQVNIAIKMIEDKIEEDMKLTQAVKEAEEMRMPRRSPLNSITSSLYSSQNSLSSNLPPREKLMAAKNDEKPMEVYVSAIATPEKFWVQIIGPKTKQLDDLVNNMTEYYSSKENRNMHKIEEPYLGQIVATVFKHDNKWYRAEVVGILPNQYNPEELVLDLYFVDYGDSEYVLPHEVFELRTDYLTLRFQAVECFLANVKTTLVNDDGMWDTRSVEAFEDITQVARWKKLTARVVTYRTYRERAKACNSNTDAREGSPVPGVELYDIQDGVETNVGDLMISLNYALPARHSYPLAHSPNMYQPSRSNSNEVLSSPTATQSPSKEQQHFVYNNSHIEPEDALIDEQLEYLEKGNNNLYLNGNTTLYPPSTSFSVPSVVNETKSKNVNPINGFQANDHKKKQKS